MDVTRCPKCDYQRQPQDSGVVAGICPACGIAYQKWRDRQQPASADAVQSVVRPAASTLLLERLSSVPESIDGMALAGRLVLYCLFFVWGCLFIVGGVDWEGIGGSFLHSVNLPFHEFGHLLFTPLGHFMSILGGSLFQVMMPLGLMLAFLFQRGDAFAASIMLWWSGQNFIDLSPYIADAPYRAIPLIRGLGESYHDWGNLLTMTGSLDSALVYARASFGIGALLMLVSFAWGGYLLYLQWRRLKDDSARRH